MKPRARGTLFGRLVAGVLGVLLIGVPLMWCVTQGILSEAPAAVLSSVTVSFARSVGLAAAVAAGAVLAGWGPACVLARARARRAWLLWAVMIPLILPRYVTYYAWSLLLSPTTGLGRYVSSHPELAQATHRVLATLTLVFWSWPLAALLLGRGQAALTPQVLAMAELDAGPWRRFFRIELALMARPALMAFLVCFVLALSEFSTFHLAGVETLGTQLAVLYELTGSDLAVVRAAWPSMIIAVMVAFCLARWFRVSLLSQSPGADGGSATPRWARWSLGLLLGTSVLMPLGLLLANMTDGEALRRFVSLHFDDLLYSFLIAATTALLSYVVAWGAMACLGRRWLCWPVWTLIFGVMFLPGSILAGALLRLLAFSPATEMLQDSWLVVALGQVPRFAGVALICLCLAYTGRRARLCEMAALDGASPGKIWRHITFPLGWRCFAGAFLVVVALSVTELSATMVLLPAGVPSFAQRLLNQMHYARDQQVIASSLLLLGAFSLVAGLCVLLFRSIIPWRHVTLMLALSLSLGIGGCEQHDSSAVGGRVISLFGKTGRGPGEFLYPRAIARTPTGEFLVIDKTGRIQRFDPEGRWLSAFTMPEIEAGKPTGMSVNADGSIYVADTHYHRILVFSIEGQLQASFGRLGEEPGSFIYPTDVAFGGDGRIYVSEYGGNDRISVFDEQFEFLYSFGQPGHEEGHLSRPSALCVDPAQDILYVADACNHRVVRYDLDGQVLGTFGSLGTEAGQLRYPYDLALMADGSIAVCEYGNNRIQVFDATGKSVALYGRAGRAAGELAYPWAIAVDDREQAYVVDAGNNRVQVWQL